MSTSLRTRDGAPSVAASIVAQEKRAAGVVPISMEGLRQWGRDNKVPIKDEKNVVERVNQARLAKGLPKFEILKGRQDIVDTLPKNHGSSKSNEARLLLATSEDELLELIVNHDGTLHRMVTPQIAAWLLALNTHNRRLDRHWVNRFVEILKNGEWQNTGEPIIVSREAILNDGQHRLQAIKESGVSIPLDIRFGVPRAAFHATGTGRKRSIGDVLAMEGYSNTSCQAAIGRLLYLYDKGKMGHLREPVEPGKILKIVSTNEDLAEVSAKIQRNKMPIVRCASFGFVLVIAARTAPKDEIFKFADVVAGGLAQSEEDPARCLHVKFRDLSISRLKLRQEDIGAMTAKAWNAWANNSPLQLKLTQADRTNAGFPRVMDWKQTVRGTQTA